METFKKERSVMRRHFTTAAKELEASIDLDHLTICEIKTHYRKTHDIYLKLEALDNKIRIKIMEVDDWLEADLEREDIDTSRYKLRWLSAETKYDSKIEQLQLQAIKSEHQVHYYDSQKKIKLPKLEIMKFDGNPKSWLPFWAQFKKVDEDDKLDPVDKFQYLLQAMAPGSDVRSFVEGFPASEKSYINCIADLKSRYAREDLLIQIYVRELLSLILNKKQDTSELTSLYDKINAQLRALETLGVTREKFAAFLLPMVESALPLETLKAWERAKPQETDDELGALLLFLKREVESEQRITMAKHTFGTSTDGKTPSLGEPSAGCLIAGVKKIEVNPKTCVWCDKNSHSSMECYKIAGMTLDQRREHLKKKKACVICLKTGHHAKVCKTYVKCYVCNKRHSAALCPGVKTDAVKDKDSPTTVTTQCTQVHGVTLLQTLMVNIVHENRKMTVRALIDNGAQRSYIRQDIADSLGIPAVGKETLSHSLFGGVQVGSKAHSVFNLKIENVQKSFNLNIVALGTKSICNNIPHVDDSDNELNNILSQHNINLTDKGKNVQDIALLIGADFSGLLMTTTMVPLANGMVAINTKLGWVLQGRHTRAVVNNLITTLFCTSDITDFWSLELIGIKDPVETKSKAQAEAEAVMSFEENVKVDSESRYETTLPWKPGHDDLLSNRELAERRLEATTKKLLTSGKFTDYDKVINEWCASGIIEVVPQSDMNKSNTHYLPHRGVVKESSLTTKLRPVFDASARDRNGKSLNSCLNKGVHFLDKIPNLLVGFRQGAIGVTADIAKAFLQIGIAHSDRDYLRFLWWKDKLQTEIVTYRHCRVVFGLTASPFLLSATINHHLNKVTGGLADTAKILAKSFYADNCLVSIDTKKDVNKFMLEAKEIMSRANFDLRMWVTSAPVLVNETGNTVVSVLGLLWNTVDDELSCNLTNLPKYAELGQVTKRSLMSLTQRVFDPVGFTCPVTLIPKLILQETWRRELAWDEQLPAELLSDFQKWYEDLHCLTDCKIPRRLTADLIQECNLSLHMFCDASKNAYAACVFLRANKGDKSTVQLLSAKARVAPPQKMTVPRLELTAALIGSRLLADAKKNLKIKICKEYCWTDSCVALCWIQKELPWNTYVGNRVREIRDNCKPCNWYHISGIHNWADLASRGCTAAQLLATRWWEGPAWLRQESGDWPKSPLTIDEKHASLELRKAVCNTSVCMDKGVVKEFCYFSKYTKIVRMVAWIQRFIYNLRNAEEKREGEITCEECEEAEKRIIKLIQTEDENLILERSANLAVFYDNDGLMRIKTKLLLSDFPENMKVPVLLPASNILVRRLVEQKHTVLQHAGANQLMADIRTRFWIIGIRRLARSVISECRLCKRYRVKPVQVTTAPLPIDRVICSAPFEVTGVDLAGPLVLKDGDKCWIVLYTCAVYRAVHLELTKSLTSESFIMTLRRFIARRGRIKQIISDNGTNLIGTKNLLSNVDWEEVQKHSTIERIRWRTNAPTAAWWGGFWERLIRIMKDLLRRVLGKSRVTYEELETILCECEAVMNRRPLTYVQDDKNECLEPLTPACFVQYLPSNDDTADLDQIDATNLNHRLRYLQKLREDFKTRFKTEYLTALVEKGKDRKDSLKVGDVVLIETDDKRVKWPLGRVTNIYPGKDGVNRTAQVKTSSGYKTRPFQRLYLLEVSTAEMGELPFKDSSLKSSGELSNCNDSPSDSVLDDTAQSHRESVPTAKTTRCGRMIRIPSKYTL